MKVQPIPKRMLIHEIQYSAYDGVNDFGKPSFSAPVTIKHVRVDDSTVFSRDTLQTKVLADAVIFVDCTHSTNVPAEFKEQSKITFNGKSYVIQKAIPVYQPMLNAIRHWELEVM